MTTCVGLERARVTKPRAGSLIGLLGGDLPGSTQRSWANGGSWLFSKIDLTVDGYDRLDRSDKPHPMPSGNERRIDGSGGGG